MYPRHLWRWGPCLSWRRRRHLFAQSEITSTHLAEMQGVAPFISVLGQIISVVPNLKEFQVFFHTIFPSLVWSTSLLLVDSSPKSICFGSLWSGILRTCPSYLSLSLRMMTSIGGTIAPCSTSVFVARSHHLIFISCLRHLWWKLLSFWRCRTWVTQVSQPYSKVWIIVALNTSNLISKDIPDGSRL